MGLRPSEIHITVMMIDVSSLTAVLDTGILLGNNSALCHSAAQD